MFSLAENFRIDPKIRKAYFRGNLQKCPARSPPEYLILGGLRLRDVNNISIPRVNSNLFFFILIF
jgi:hypothetical protein